ncbi:hypothetical protein SGRI78S_00549 [Streptomyces griseus subsp. griseus]
MQIGPQEGAPRHVHHHRDMDPRVTDQVVALTDGAGVEVRPAPLHRRQRHEPGERVGQQLERHVVVAEHHRHREPHPGRGEPAQVEVRVFAGAPRRGRGRQVAGVHGQPVPVDQVGVVAEPGVLPVGVEERHRQVEVDGRRGRLRPVQEHPQHFALGQVLGTAPGNRHQRLGRRALGGRYGERGQPLVEHRQIEAGGGGEPPQHFALQQRADPCDGRGRQRGTGVVQGERVRHPAPGEEDPPGAGDVTDPQPAQRRQQRTGAGPGESALQRLDQRVRRLPVPRRPQHVVQSAQEGARSPGEQRDRGVGVARGEGLLDPPGPGVGLEQRAVRTDRPRVFGCGTRQGRRERLRHRGQMGGPQHREGEGGPGVARVLLVGVQRLTGPLPPLRVPQQVLDE